MKKYENYNDLPLMLSVSEVATVLGIAVSTIQDRINLLEKRKLIAVKKHTSIGKYKNNVYVLLPQDNPDIYRDLSESEELPMYIT